MRQRQEVDMPTHRATATSSRVITVIVLLWLLIGVAAAAQRNYFAGSDASCAKVGTVVVTIVAGPLNYVGANPKVACEAPQPSR
jgi:membrane protein YdbS with pleckstrin-like domain